MGEERVYEEAFELQGGVLEMGIADDVARTGDDFLRYQRQSYHCPEVTRHR